MRPCCLAHVFLRVIGIAPRADIEDVRRRPQSLDSSSCKSRRRKSGGLLISREAADPAVLQAPSLSASADAERGGRVSPHPAARVFAPLDRRAADQRSTATRSAPHRSARRRRCAVNARALRHRPFRAALARARAPRTRAAGDRARPRARRAGCAPAASFRRSSARASSCAAWTARAAANCAACSAIRSLVDGSAAFTLDHLRHCDRGIKMSPAARRARALAATSSDEP